MELIKISDGKLKVMLSPEDMARYAISCETLDYDNTETRRAFWDILDIAKHETGFDAARDKVYIQAYPSRTGGCELFVTKLAEQACPPEGEPTPKWQFWRVGSLAVLLSLCAQLAASGVHTESRAHRTEDDVCWLALAADVAAPLLAEYATKEYSPYLEAWLSEHGRCLCAEHAIETLATLV